MRHLQFIEENRAEILGLAAEHGARNVRVFGSVARHEAGQGCDIDFLVELDEGRDLFDLGALLMDLRDLLGCPVDIMTEPSLHERIREQVLREAVQL